MDGRFRLLAEQDSYAIIRKQEYTEGYRMELAIWEANGRLETFANAQYSDQEGKDRQSIMKKCKAGLLFLAFLAVGALIVLL